VALVMRIQADNQMRVAVLLEQDFCHPSWRFHSFNAAISREFPDGELFPVRNNYAVVAEKIADRRADFQCVISFCYFSRMRHQAAAMASIGLPLVLYETDTLLNYRTGYYKFGRLSNFLSICPVDILVTTGKWSFDRFTADGQHCFYLPKAAPAAFLSQPNRHSGHFCLFGSFKDPIYADRAALFEQITPSSRFEPMRLVFPETMTRLRQRLAARRREPGVHRLRFRFSQMAAVLRHYSGVVICDKGLNETMAKHFEIAALGLAPFRDNEVVDELEELGYRDGQSMVVYESVDDLREKLNYYGRHNNQLMAIQHGARAASVHNTWERRASDLKRFLLDRY